MIILDLYLIYNYNFFSPVFFYVFPFLCFLGNLGKLRRAFVNYSENGRGHTDMLQTIVLKVTNIDDRTLNIEKKFQEREVRERVERFNILPYFPVSSLAVLEDFLSNDDGNFKEKKEEFETYIYSVCSLSTDMDTFCASLLKTLFRKDFIREHRWPSTEYV